MKLHHNRSLKALNTFGIDATARLLAEIHSPDDLEEVLSEPALTGDRRFVLGGGSNVLLTGDVDGLVLLNRMVGIERPGGSDDQVLVKSWAGTTWHDLVLYAISEDLGGIENLSLIPGCVGAAPIQNIGAYGVELKDVFHELHAVDLSTGEHATFSLAACEFGYRNSVFKHRYKNRYIITSVTLRLSRKHKLNTTYGAIEEELQRMGAERNIRTISQAVINIRSSKLPDPAKIGNAGSFFKNPEVTREVFLLLKEKYPDLVAYPAPAGMKLAAGWLIEQCGWKGKVSGNVGMHNRQALVLVNYGGATGTELYSHAKKVQDSVLDKFGVTLEMEVNVIS